MLKPHLTNAKQLRSRIISGSVVLLSGSSLATAINLAYNVAIARFLGPRGFGHATAVYTLLTLASAVTLSFQIISAKVVAQRDPEHGRDAAYRYLHRGAWICGGLVALVLLVFQRGIANYLHLPNSGLIALLAIAAAFYVPLGSRRGYIQGVFGFRSLATNLVLEGAVRLAGSLLMIALGLGVAGVIAANAAGIAVAYLAIAPKLAPKSLDTERLGHGFREILQAMVFNSGLVLINNCDIVLVKHFFASEEAGLYAAIAMVGRVTFAFSSAVVNSMFPVVAGAKKEERRNLSLIAISLLMVFSVGSLFALCLRFTPDRVWTIFFGSRFLLQGPHGFSYLLALYAITTVIYSLSVVIISYEMSYKIANNSWIQLIFSGVLIAGISRFHDSLEQVIMVQLVLMVVLLLFVAVPFLLEALRNANAQDYAGARDLRLIRRITEDQVISEFLKSEFDDAAYSEYHEAMRAIVFSPDLESQDENAKRRALLYLRHRALWKELPPETEWYVAEVGEDDLDQIRVFPRAQWRKLARGNFAISEVVERLKNRQPEPADSFGSKITGIRQGISEGSLNSGSVVLIGRDETSPVTVLDGNHRFVAAVMEGRMDTLRFVCGMSPAMDQCCWYKTNVSTLTRYGRNLLRHVFRHPRAELESLFERAG